MILEVTQLNKKKKYWTLPFWASCLNSLLTSGERWNLKSLSSLLKATFSDCNKISKNPTTIRVRSLVCFVSSPQRRKRAKYFDCKSKSRIPRSRAYISMGRMNYLSASRSALFKRNLLRNMKCDQCM